MRLNDGIEQLRRSALEPIRLHEEISRATRLASTRIVEVMRVNQQRWQHMIDQATAMSSMQATAALRMTDLTHTHRTWLCNLKPTQDQAAKLQIAVKLSLESIAARGPAQAHGRVRVRQHGGNRRYHASHHPCTTRCIHSIV